MSGPAYVGSFEAVRDFRAALVIFLHEAREALAAHDVEVRRSLEWLLDAEPKRWQQIARDCDEEATQAKIELERCRSSRLPGGETPSCIEERKALERARQRRQYAEDKIEAVRKWARVLDHEADEYSARASQLSTLVDVDLVGAVAMLDRVLMSLEAYAALAHPAGQSVAPASGMASMPAKESSDESAAPAGDARASSATSPGAPALDEADGGGSA